MENKKVKLTISGKPKKPIKSFESPKPHSGKPVSSSRPQNRFNNKGSSFRPNKPLFASKKQSTSNDFEKRKLAEQRATKRLKDEGNLKDKKVKLGTKKREVKLTVSRALSDEIEARERSLASVKRAREKENKNLNKNIKKRGFKACKKGCEHS